MSFSRIAGLRNLLSGPSAGNSRSFTSTSSLLAESKRKRAARLKKQANQARKIRAAQEERQTAPDLILGYNPSTDAGVKLWQDSKLANILLSPRQVWGTTVEAARQSGSSAPSLDDGLELQDQCTIPEPQAWNFGLTNEEASFLFEGLPRFNAAQSTSTDTNQLEQGVQNEQDKVDQLKRILDLKNANAQGIWVENSRRIVKEFGRTGAHDTASPEVQGALLTARIHNIRQHLRANNHKDISNQQALRHLINQRVKVFRYLKRESLTRWAQLLKDCGLDERAVSGQIVITRDMMRGLKSAKV